MKLVMDKSKFDGGRFSTATVNKDDIEVKALLKRETTPPDLVDQLRYLGLTVLVSKEYYYVDGRIPLNDPYKIEKVKTLLF